MKYITTETDEGTREVFVFPNTINHDAYAESMYRLRNQTHGDWRRIERTPVSAGFINSDGECYGRSESLNLESHEGDTEIFRSQ